MERETITISSVASRGPQIVTTDSDSNEPTIPYGFGIQYPIVPHNLKDLKLPPNPFNVSAVIAVMRADEVYNPQSPAPSIPSPISTPPMNVSTIEGPQTTHTTTDDATFYTGVEPRQDYWVYSSGEILDSNEPSYVSIASSPSSTPPPPRRQKTKLNMGMSFPKKNDCRSTHARHGDSPYQPKRHPNAQKKLKHYTLLIKL